MSVNVGQFAANTHSQYGEDGIIAAIVGMLGTRKTGWAVEIGASDGVTHSNTLALERRGWKCVCVEADSYAVRCLHNNRPEAIIVDAMVGPGADDGVDAILEGVDGCPSEFDVLSIDVDGIDWHVLSSMKACRPAVVVIEFNMSMPKGVSFVQPLGGDFFTGSSLEAIVELGKSKGYSLVAVTHTNAVLVRSDIADEIGIEVVDETARPQSSLSMTAVTFYSYDGRRIVYGNTISPWDKHYPPVRAGVTT